MGKIISDDLVRDLAIVLSLGGHGWYLPDETKPIYNESHERLIKFITPLIKDARALPGFAAKVSALRARSRHDG